MLFPFDLLDSTQPIKALTPNVSSVTEVFERPLCVSNEWEIRGISYLFSQAPLFKCY